LHQALHPALIRWAPPGLLRESRSFLQSNVISLPPAGFPGR
jgi:hypothetical protein